MWLDQEFRIDLAGFQQAMDQGQDEQPVGAGGDGDEFIGDRGVAGAHRIDRDDLGAALLEPAEAELDRVGIVVLGDADHQEEFCLFPVGLAEFPERAAHGIEPGGRHVDRAEPAMRGEIPRAEHLREIAGERLRLVAAGEEGKAVRVGRADMGEPLGCDRERLFPLDLVEFAGAARADALQRLAQPRWRQRAHDPGRALAAQHAAVDRVVAVALDIAQRAVLQMDFDAAAAGAHVAGGIGDLIADRLRILDHVAGHWYLIFNLDDGP